MLRIVIASLLICSRAWAISPGQFWQEIIDHRSRVKEDMLMVLNKNPARFSSLDAETVSEYALLHDVAKARPQYFNGLLRFYGVNRRSLNPRDRVAFDNLRSQINAVEAVEKSKFFSTVSPKAESQLLELEHIADTVDTGIYRVTEVGEATLGSKFLKFVEAAEPEVVEIAEDLESVLMVVK